LFRHKLHVNPDIFDDILNQISDHPIFHNNSNNPQLPVSIQLAIFLNHAGHYGNSITLEDAAQWAGVSVGSIVNCTNRIIIALLDQHDTFMGFPSHDSEDFEHAWRYTAQATTCPEWQNCILAVDGTTIDLYATPGFYHQVFYDRKSKYSLGCQVSSLYFIFQLKIKNKFKAAIMPHNLLIVDYSLGHPGSVHDAYALRSTHLYHEHDTLLPAGHWIWADSAYPLNTWCIPPFKKPCNGRLTANQRTFNFHLSSVCFFYLHFFLI
ncbi:hypothetical protein BDR06DRAFT_881109, partial [Suillus hirtellus]